MRCAARCQPRRPRAVDQGGAAARPRHRAPRAGRATCGALGAADARGGFDALVALREQGAIRGFGLGVNEIAVCLDAIHAAPLDVLLLANRYTLLEQTPLDALFPRCARRGIAVIAGAPLSSGILATGTRGSTPPIYDYAPAPDAIVARVRRMEAVADAWAIPLAAAALHLPLMQRCVAAVLPGIPDPLRLAQTLDHYRRPMPPGFWPEMVAEGLIRADGVA